MSRPAAIVTGGARGIGLASARHLARAGYAVALVDRDAKALRTAADTLVTEGASVEIFEGDVTDHARVTAIAKQAEASLGPLSVLVNNAGISSPQTILEIDESDWDRTLTVHLKGAFYWSRALAPAMVARGSGRIINISSVSAHTGGGTGAVSRVAYCTAKAGLLGMTRAMAKELAPHINVNAICPGLIHTDLTDALVRDRGEIARRAIPLGRLGTPDDVAVVVTFLATVNPCFITGEIIDVDGGQWVN